MNIEMFLQLSEPVVITDSKKRIIKVNSFCEKLTGYYNEELIGKKINIFKSDLTPIRVYKEMYKTLKESNWWKGVITCHKKDNSIFHTHVSLTKIEHLNKDFYVGICRNLEEISRGVYLSDDQLEEWRSSVLFTIARIAESEDPHINSHVNNVKRYVEILTMLYKQHINNHFSEFNFSNIGKASILHDVGKSMIPKSILYKPGKLTNIEYDIVKQHTLQGFDLIQEIQFKSHMRHSGDLISLAQCIATYHHEKWDGTGYPHGLNGEEIPIEARIVAIADVLDALRSHRVYKPTWEENDIIDYFKQNKEKHFDPKLVDLLIDNFDLFKKEKV